MRDASLTTLAGFILLVVLSSLALAQTATTTPWGGIANWWWVLLVAVVAAAVWYFMRNRRTPEQPTQGAVPLTKIQTLGALGARVGPSATIEGLLLSLKAKL